MAHIPGLFLRLAGRGNVSPEGKVIKSITSVPVTSVAIIPAPIRRWTTPRILHAAQAGLFLSALLLFLASLAGVRQQRQAVKTIGQDAAPSIIEAQSVKAALADLDANVANELMVKPGQNASSIGGYAQRRKEIGDGLIRAAENITYGDAERGPILTLEAALSDYETLTTRARTLHERHDDAAALEAYRQAYRVLEETLLPAADALSRANSEALDHAYAHVNAASAGAIALLWTVGALLLAALIATQLFLTRRMRRILNPALLAATLVTLCFLTLLTGRLRSATAQLKIAKGPVNL